jgi:hypothetical protein
MLCVYVRVGGQGESACMCTRNYRKALGLGVKINYLILAAISFLGKYTAIPLVFTCFKSTMEVIFLNAAEYHL